MLRLLKTVGAILLVSTVLYTAVDLTYGYLKHRPADGEALNLHPSGAPADENQSYVTVAFSREVQTQPGEWDRIPGQKLATPSEYHGQYFNVDRLEPTGNLYRRTINPGNPGKPRIVVLVVGSSTIYGAIVPDELTIPSLLSARMNALDPAHDYVVYNAGVFGTNSTEDRDRLSYEIQRGLKPNIIVVCDGSLDIQFGIYQGRPDGSTTLQAHRQGLRGFIRRYVPLNIFKDLLMWYNSRAVAAGLKQTPSHLKDPATLDQLTRQTVDIYMRNQLAMAQVAKQQQARFITVLSPSPYSTAYAHKTADLDFVVQGVERQMPGLGAILPIGQRAMSEALSKLEAQGIDTLDLSDMFKDKTINVFYDPGHLNGTGNEAMADRIAEAVLRSRPASEP